MRRIVLVVALCVAMLGGKPSLAQVENILKVSTIERKPFAFQVGGEWQGFSIDLWNKIAESLDRETIYLGHTTFQDMLKSVENGEVDLAAANISVTSARETVMDFSRPIFDSGLLILTETDGSPSMFAAFLNRKLWSWIGSAVLLFLLAGIAISVFEHRNVHFQGRGKGDRFREGFWWVGKCSDQRQLYDLHPVYASWPHVVLSTDFGGAIHGVWFRCANNGDTDGARVAFAS